MKTKHMMMAMFVASSFAFVAQPAFATTIDFYGTYTDGATLYSGPTGADLPSISGGLAGGPTSPGTYFKVENLSPGGAAAPAAYDTGGLLFTVAPYPCLTGTKNTNSCVKTGTETVTITLDDDHTRYDILLKDRFGLFAARHLN